MRITTTHLLLAVGLAAAGCTVGNTGDDDGTGAEPPAPSALAITVVNGGAHLTWTDNATDETQYMVMRMDDGGEYAIIATLPADTAVYHDASVAAGVDYMYMVMVMNNAGETGSSEVEFTLP